MEDRDQRDRKVENRRRAYSLVSHGKKKQFPFAGRQGLERNESGNQKENIFRNFSRNSLRWKTGTREKGEQKLAGEHIQQFLTEQFPFVGRQGPERKESGNQKGNIFTEQFPSLGRQGLERQEVENRRGTYSAVSHGTVSFCWKTGTREKGEWKLEEENFQLFLTEQRERRIQQKLEGEHIQQFLTEQFLSDGRQEPESKESGNQKKNIFSSSSRNSFLLMEDRAQRERRVELEGEHIQ